MLNPDSRYAKRGCHAVSLKSRVLHMHTRLAPTDMMGTLNPSPLDSVDSVDF